MNLYRTYNIYQYICTLILLTGDNSSSYRINQIVKNGGCVEDLILFLHFCKRFRLIDILWVNWERKSHDRDLDNNCNL